MKTNKILNITLLSTIILFSACSSSQKQLKKEPSSVYNIMGITQSSEPVVEYNNNISSDLTYLPSYIPYQEPINSPIIEPQNDTTSNITYISYKEPQNNYGVNPNLLTVQNIEYIAKSFLGTPYVWGATGPNKFDCSGFTQWVYRDSGINIPRVSRDQARVGQYVSYDQLQRGDMVFFDTHKKRTGRVSHVGIYLGGGNFIHASSAGKSVVIYNFNQKPFYKKRFLWGRRVLRPNIHYALN